MILRNIVEIVVLAALLILMIGIYFYAKKRVSDIESDIIILQKSQIRGKTERFDHAD